MTKEPWNKNKSIGQKKALTPEQIRLIQKELAENCRTRDLVLFNMALSSDLTFNKILRLKVFELNQGGLLYELCRPLIEDKQKEDYLFSGKYPNTHMTRGNCALLIKNWVKMVGLDPKEYSTRSIINARHRWRNT